MGGRDRAVEGVDGGGSDDRVTGGGRESEDDGIDDGGSGSDVVGSVDVESGVDGDFIGFKYCLLKLFCIKPSILFLF